jgi:hypothetical protein
MEDKLEYYGKHVPGILRRQLISKLTKHYTDKSELKPDSFENDCLNTSMERFHCALLFVDISGFTVLSQKLSVDDLRRHINAYFKKILDIVDKHGGEAIKFAGDALFIIWQTESNVVGKFYSHQNDMSITLSLLNQTHTVQNPNTHLSALWIVDWK